jgi:hypothetical protein
MLHRANYYNFTTRFIVRHLDHDDTIPESELKKHAYKMNQLWIARAKKKKLTDPIEKALTLLKKRLANTNTC